MDSTKLYNDCNCITQPAGLYPSLGPAMQNLATELSTKQEGN